MFLESRSWTRRTSGQAAPGREQAVSRFLPSQMLCAWGWEAGGSCLGGDVSPWWRYCVLYCEHRVRHDWIWSVVSL